MPGSNFVGPSARASISWEDDSLDVLKAWPRDVQRDIGLSPLKLQEGERPALPARPMQSIGQGVFELKTADESAWYRVIYLARIEKHDLCTGFLHQEEPENREKRPESSEVAVIEGSAAPPERENRCQAQKRQIGLATSRRATCSKTWDSPPRKFESWRSSTNFGYRFVLKSKRASSPKPN